MPFSEQVRLTVKKLANFTCCWCQDRAKKVHVHHIKPQSQSGPDTEDNAAPLCGSCHDLYGNNPDLRKEVRYRRDHWYEVCAAALPTGQGEVIAVLSTFEKQLVRITNIVEQLTTAQVAGRTFGHREIKTLQGASEPLVTYSGERVKLKLRDALLTEIASSFQASFRKNIVVYPKFSPKVSAWGDLPWDEALVRMCKDVHYGVRYEGAITRVAPLALLETEDRLLPLPLSFTGEAIDVEFKDASFLEAMDVFAETEGLRLFIGDGIGDFPVTINVKSVPVDQARDLICRMNGLACAIDGSTVVVKTLDRYH